MYPTGQIGYKYYRTRSYYDPKTTMQKVSICLTMIVRNESKVILRCLKSARPIIDFVNICDTGSLDDTKKLVTDWCEEEGLEYRIHDHEWKNFGHNRTLSITSAIETFPHSTYLLLIDADMILNVHDDFDKDRLKSLSYTIRQGSQSLSYLNIRLIKNDGVHNWSSIGVTHEYYNAVPSVQSTRLDTLHINDIGDGGHKTEKFIRDEALLEQGIIDEPTNTRYYFYLMQTKQDMGKPDEAIELGNKVISMNGWLEERSTAAYRIGLIYDRKGDWSKALEYYIKSYGLNNTRSEPLYQIARHYRTLSEHWLCYTFSMMGNKIPFPTGGLFVHNHTYQGLFDYELSICCYYINGMEELGYASCLKVLGSLLPQGYKEHTASNIKFYEKKYPHLVLKYKKKAKKKNKH